MRNNFKGFLSQQQKVFIVANGLDCNSDFWIMGEPDDELNKIMLTNAPSKGVVDNSTK